jgi:hypothetical protein
MAAYTQFATNDIVITTEKVFTNTWTDGSNTLTEFGANYQVGDTIDGATSPSASKQFFIEVTNLETTNANAKTQFTISYGHKKGSGSKLYTTDDDGYSATRSVYSQYRSLVYGDETRNFVFDNDEPDDIMVINIARAAYKQQLRLGSLKLQVGSDYLTDDSKTNSGSAVLTNLGRQFKVVNGGTDEAAFVGGQASGDGLRNSKLPGFFYPDAGLIILNCNAFTEVDDMSSVSDTNGLEHQEFLADISEFTVDTQENISSQFYFVRARNQEFNYSSNPSFIDSTGDLTFTSMIDNPTTYITTIGLYNAQNELLAVAKLSQPIKKDFTKEALIKVKLDY